MAQSFTTRQVVKTLDGVITEHQRFESRALTQFVWNFNQSSRVQIKLDHVRSDHDIAQIVKYRFQESFSTKYRGRPLFLEVFVDVTESDVRRFRESESLFSHSLRQNLCIAKNLRYGALQ